jgi:hypothetical protein
MIINPQAIVRNSYFQQLRVFYAIGLLIVGVLYPEEKTLILGFHWPPFIVIVGILLIVTLKRNLFDGIVLSVFAAFWVSFAFTFSLTISAFYKSEMPYSEAVLRHYLTILGGTLVSFMLISDLSVKLILQGIFRFMLTFALALLAVRLLLFDFSREGTFLGLGPLTFAKYISIGWIAQIAKDGRLRLLPSCVFAMGLLLSDSKGPILFLIITIMIWVTLESERDLARSNFLSRIKWTRWALIIVSCTFLILSERFFSFFSDLHLLVTQGYNIPEVVDFEAIVETGVITSTMARLIAIVASVELIVQNPLIGWGIGSWPEITGLYYLEYPHNSVLEIWVEYGIASLVVFIFFVFRAARGVILGNPFSLFVIFCCLLSLTTGSVRDLRVLLFFTLLSYHFKYIYTKPQASKHLMTNE